METRLERYDYILNKNTYDKFTIYLLYEKC